MTKRILLKPFTLLIVTLFCASCASSSVKQDVACTKKILSAIDLSKKASIAYTLADFEVAEKLFKQVIDIDPDNERALFKLGNIYSNTGRHEAAIESYHKILQLNPEHNRASHNLGMVYLGQAKFYLSRSKDSGSALDEFATEELKRYLQHMLENI